MLESFRSFLSLIRFSHTVFALPFALMGAALAWKQQGSFSWVQLIGILLCMVFARSAAMTFNRLVDRKYDAANPRTATRHLPAGTIGLATAWIYFVGSAVAFLATTVLFLVFFDNPWPVILSGPVLLFICLYSLTKRFTVLSHFWLGASLLAAPVASWIAIRGLPGWPEMLTPVFLGGAVLFWVAGFDILYACQDVDFDRKVRLHSIPAALGLAWSLRVAMLCHLVMILFLLALFFTSAPTLGFIYLGGVVGVALLLFYEHSLVSPTNLAKVNQAFFQVNGVISIGLLVIILVQLFVPW